MENGIPAGFVRSGGAGRREITASDAAAANTSGPKGMIKAKIPQGANVNMTLDQLKTTLRRHRGSAQVLIYLPDGKILKTDRNMWAEPTNGAEDTAFQLSWAGKT